MRKAKIMRTEEEKKELRLKEALNRRPTRWGKLTLVQFEEDIALLQATIRAYQEKEKALEEQHKKGVLMNESR